MNPLIPAAELEPTAVDLAKARALADLHRGETGWASDVEAGALYAHLPNVIYGLEVGDPVLVARAVRQLRAAVAEAEAMRAQWRAGLAARYPEPKPVAA